jgi:carbamoyltransferase
MATILGISCFYHDSAACLVRDGEIVAAAQEERFTRKKHDPGFPRNAVDYCLQEGACSPAELDAVVFHEKPLLKFDRLLATWLATAPVGFRSFLAALPNWLKEKLYHPRLIRRELGGGYRRAVLFCGHHESHAASAFYPSPFKEAAILTLDGVGEWETATIGIGQGNNIRILKSLQFPHSLGLLYSAFTYYLGFRVNSGEYKVMGLAPYGRPVYRDLILDKLIALKEDGSFQLDISFFNYISGLTMTSRKFHDLFGGPPRRPESPLTQREMDLAASLQAVMEDIILRMAGFVREVTGMERICLAGGVALNSVANGKLIKSGLFDDVWIQPASGDAGGALGAALRVEHGLFGTERRIIRPDAMKGALLGEAFSDTAIRTVLDAEKARYTVFEDEGALLAATVAALSAGKVVGWFQGRMEYGPRALGNRSILGDPRNPEMQRTLNLKIKFRESFRPFAPVVLVERAGEYFDLKGASPYMLVVDQVKGAWLKEVDEEALPPTGEARMRALLSAERSVLQAVTHVDNSARVQTVDAERNPLFHRLLTAWEAQTGIAVLVNTSFNIRGEPIVRTPEDAWRCFVGTEMDILVMGNCLILKEENRHKAVDTAQYRGEYPLD